MWRKLASTARAGGAGGGVPSQTRLQVSMRRSCTVFLLRLSKLREESHRAAGGARRQVRHQLPESIEAFVESLFPLVCAHLSRLCLEGRRPERFRGRGARTLACSVHTLQKPSTWALILKHFVGRLANLRRIGKSACFVGQPILAAAAFPGGSLRLAIRRFLPQETFPPGIVCRSCERDMFNSLSRANLATEP